MRLRRRILDLEDVLPGREWCREAERVVGQRQRDVGHWWRARHHRSVTNDHRLRHPFHHVRDLVRDVHHADQGIRARLQVLDHARRHTDVGRIRPPCRNRPGWELIGGLHVLHGIPEVIDRLPLAELDQERVVEIRSLVHEPDLGEAGVDCVGAREREIARGDRDNLRFGAGRRRGTRGVRSGLCFRTRQQRDAQRKDDSLHFEQSPGKGGAREIETVNRRLARGPANRPGGWRSALERATRWRASRRAAHIPGPSRPDRHSARRSHPARVP